MAEDSSRSILAETTITTTNLILSSILILKKLNTVLDITNRDVRLATILDTGSSCTSSNSKGRENSSSLYFSY